MRASTLAAMLTIALPFAFGQLQAGSSIITLTSTDYVLNLDSRECAWPAPIGTGTPVQLTLTPGVWEVTPTNPALNTHATFTAWSYFGGGSWIEAMHTWGSNGDRYSKGGDATGVYFSPTDAFYNDPLNATFYIQVTSTSTYQFFTGDSYLGDNAGGVSVVVSQISAVPEPATYVIVCGMIALLAGGLRRRQRQPSTSAGRAAR